MTYVEGSQPILSLNVQSAQRALLREIVTLVFIEQSNIEQHLTIVLIHRLRIDEGISKRHSHQLNVRRTCRMDCISQSRYVLTSIALHKREIRQ